MTKLKQLFQSYHPLVNALMLGTVFITLTMTMSMPFLAIYLKETTTLDYAMIGLIIGAGPLAGTLGGFVGGILSDFFGRKKLMIFSLLVLALSFAGFVYSSQPVFLLCLSMLRGIANGFFNTISKALMGDLTPEDQRFRMFSHRYLANNIGWVIGPIVGAFLGIGGSAGTFLLTAGVYVLYVLVLIFLFRVYGASDLPDDGEGCREEQAEAVSLVQMWRVLRSDTALFCFIIGGILLTTVHGQMSVPLSQYLKEHFDDGVKLFGLMMSVSAATVVIFQAVITRIVERYTLFRRISGGALLMAAGEVGFAYSTEWIGLFAAIIVFTFGEILVLPAEYAQIDQITPQGMRGTYYGAQSFSEFGNFLGPWISGMLMAAFSGQVMFLANAAIAIFSLSFYWLGQRIYLASRLKIQL